MATNNWPVPDDDAAEQAASTTGEDEPVPPSGPAAEANEADTIEQTQELPEDDEYRDQ